MKRIATVGLLSLAAASVSHAATYNILATSTMDDVRRIGGRSIPELSQYSGYGGGLNVQDPSLWPILDKDMATFPTYSAGVATGGVEGNSINVIGTIEVVGGQVVAATITQVGALSLGMFQSEVGFAGATTNVWANLVTGDPSLQIGAAFGTPGTTLLNPLTWTLGSNSLGQTLQHQGKADPVAAASLTNQNFTSTCVPLGPPPTSATGIPGQCSQLVGAVNVNGAFGGTTNANSVWNFTGVAANYLVSDTASTPWATASGTNGINISGASGLAGVVFDLSGFDSLTGGVITARAVADALASAATNSSGSGISAQFTLQLAPVPIPAGVWLFGSALGLVAWLRRRAAAA